MAEIDVCVRSEALRPLSEGEETLLREIGFPTQAEAGERLIAEGSPGAGFYLLLEGRAGVLKGGVQIAELEAGAAFGEMSFFNRDARTAEVRALEACRLLFVSRETLLERVLCEEPAAVRLMEALGELMVRRMQELDDRILAAASSTGPETQRALEQFAQLRRPMLAQWALAYHALGTPGKLAVVPTKSVGTAADLSVAYSPGVAEPCLSIQRNPDAAYEYTTRGHLVGVISNGTAVLGLGNIGALASKPVMEGKAVLFKRFAGLDAFDIEVDEPDPQRFVDVVCALAPTFGAINLEDVRAPDCFFVEAEVRRRLEIPVLHDDQHGTAVVAGAGLLNALELIDKPIEEIRVVFSGAGAAGFACARHFLRLGVRREHLVLTDIHGVVYRGRGDGNYLEELAADTEERTLAGTLRGADVFVGVSAPNILTPDMLLTMSRDPVVFALANPVPEIDYRLARETREDALVATGRSDYPNQINNVIAFPYLFRGALDARARGFTDEMVVAATRAVATLAREAGESEDGPGVAEARFGREHLVPLPFDRRLLPRVSASVAGAAMESGAARIALDLDAYRERLTRQSLETWR